jgi:hypothetical protein
VEERRLSLEEKTVLLIETFFGTGRAFVLFGCLSAWQFVFENHKSTTGL